MVRDINDTKRYASVESPQERGRLKRVAFFDGIMFTEGYHLQSQNEINNQELYLSIDCPQSMCGVRVAEVTST
jgi:hypothetical protein